MPVRITARKDILDGSTQCRLPDDGLAALNGIVSETIDNKENDPLDKVVDGFLRRHPDFRGAGLEIEYLIPGRGEAFTEK